MNKSDLIEKVSVKANISKKEASTAIEAFLESVTEVVGQKDSVTLAGFGSFDVVHRAERNGHNPHTGQSMVIPASYVLKFKAAKKLKDVVNQEQVMEEV